MSIASTIPFIPVGGGRLNVFFHGAGSFLTKLKLFGEGAEIGTQLGDWANDVLSTWKGKKLWCVDPWVVQPSDYQDYKWTQSDMDIFYQRAKDRLSAFGERVEIIRECSIDASKKFQDGQLDFVYIDALHTFKNATEDIDAWWPKIKEGGLLFGDDYRVGPWVGVIDAVDNFSQKHQLPVFFDKSVFDKPRVLSADQQSGLDNWYIFK